MLFGLSELAFSQLKAVFLIPASARMTGSLDNSRHQRPVTYRFLYSVYQPVERIICGIVMSCSIGTSP
jgi:hypothetical protein